MSDVFFFDKSVNNYHESDVSKSSSDMDVSITLNDRSSDKLNDLTNYGDLSKSLPVVFNNSYNINNSDPTFSWPPRKNQQYMFENHIRPTNWLKGLMDVDESGIFPNLTKSELNANKYRNNIGKNFKNKCIISLVDQIECECAHIIPRNICEKFNLNFKYHIANGLLLNRNLHILFDNFVWTFDIYDYKDVCDNYVNLSIIIKKNKNNYTICNYQYDDNHCLRYYKIPICSLPYLFIQYNMFFYKNYSKINLSDDKLYENLLCHNLFVQTLNEPNMFFSIVQNYKNNNNNKTAKFVLNKTVDNKCNIRCLVLWEYYSFSECSWEFTYNVNQEIVKEYDYILETNKDPDFF